MNVLATLLCPTCQAEAEYGMEYRRVYDGVLFWVCTNGHPFPRFNSPHRLHDVALKQMNTEPPTTQDGAYY